MEPLIDTFSKVSLEEQEKILLQKWEEEEQQKLIEEKEQKEKEVEEREKEEKREKERKERIQKEKEEKEEKEGVEKEGVGNEGVEKKSLKVFIPKIELKIEEKNEVDELEPFSKSKNNPKKIKKRNPKNSRVESKKVNGGREESKKDLLVKMKSFKMIHLNSEQQLKEKSHSQIDLKTEEDRFKKKTDPINKQKRKKKRKPKKVPQSLIVMPTFDDVELLELEEASYSQEEKIDLSVFLKTDD